MNAEDFFKNYHSICRWMQKYKSKIIRFYYFGGQERVLVADPEIVRRILVTNSRNYSRPLQT